MVNLPLTAKLEFNKTKYTFPEPKIWVRLPVRVSLDFIVQTLALFQFRIELFT